jgi:hypothetical protein
MGGEAMKMFLPQNSIRDHMRFLSFSLMAAVILLPVRPAECRGQAESEDPGDKEAATAVSDAAADKEQPVALPFALRPYRVQLSVSMNSSTGGRLFDPEATLGSIQRNVSRMYGRMWQLDAYEADWLCPGTPEQIRRLKAADIAAQGTVGENQTQFPESESDKVIFLAVQSTTAGIDVFCREYDTRLHDLSPVLQASTPDVRGIGSVAARLVRDSFRPCLNFVRKYTDDAGLQFMELQAQAGELPAADFAAEQVREGDVLRLFLRKMDRRDPTKLGSLREVPLTYVRVLSVDDSITRGLTTGVLLAHGSVSPFGSRSRNVQHLALRQRPSASSSKVRLVERSEQRRPLICQRVSIAYKLRSTDADELDQLNLLSDRNGEFTVPAHPDHPTVWVYVYSGSRTLARVPYAPGLLPIDTIVLPDDSIRLSVEGDLQLFQDKLVDSVAMREVQFSLAQRAADDGRAEDCNRALDEYLAIPDKEDFIDELSLIRVAAVRRSIDSQNPRAKRDVEKLCKGVEESIELFFNETKRTRRLEAISRLREELAEQPTGAQ